jgi:D-alanyl-D-alanine-carboxypeptidase/D-alanyl-D-alanine-endopeptidase
MSVSPQVVASLDEVLGSGIEEMFAHVYKKKLVDGVVVGVYRRGHSYIRLLGSGISETSGFEIGSLTKVFTIQLIDNLTHQGLLRWDDPVAKYFPKNLGSLPLEAHECLKATILDIATHRSGLPLLPENLKIRDGSRPFEAYGTADLEAYLRQYRRTETLSNERKYSNLGFAVLGYALENATGSSFSELLERELLRPMGLNNTFLSLTGGVMPQLVAGHTLSGRLAPHWKQDVLAAAGGLCSSVSDQLLWMETVLSEPSRKMFELYADTKNVNVGVGWSIDPVFGSYCGRGTTGGFCCYMGISPERQSGIVVLMNRQTNLLRDVIAENCERALLGLPLLSIRGDYGKLKAKSLEPLQDLKRRLNAMDFFWNYLRAES